MCAEPTGQGQGGGGGDAREGGATADMDHEVAPFEVPSGFQVNVIVSSEKSKSEASLTLSLTKD